MTPTVPALLILLLLAPAPNATFRLLPSRNHVFVEGDGPSMPAENERPGHVPEEVVEAVGTWAKGLPSRARP